MELLEAKAQTEPIRLNHLHFAGDNAAMRDWYVKTFGATAQPGSRCTGTGIRITMDRAGRPRHARATFPPSALRTTTPTDSPGTIPDTPTRSPLLPGPHTACGVATRTWCPRLCSM